jgi:hypothetical protein
MKPMDRAEHVWRQQLLPQPTWPAGSNDCRNRPLTFGVTAVRNRWPPAERRGVEMLIDCETCTVRGLACSDCVVSVLLGVPDDGAELDGPEQDAIGVLADAGLVPPLRLVAPAGPPVNGPETPGARHLPHERSAG